MNNETNRALVTPSGDDKKSSNASASSKGKRASSSKASKDLSTRAKYYQDMIEPFKKNELASFAKLDRLKKE